LRSIGQREVFAWRLGLKLEGCIGTRFCTKSEKESQGRGILEGKRNPNSDTLHATTKGQETREGRVKKNKELKIRLYRRQMRTRQQQVLRWVAHWGVENKSHESQHLRGDSLSFSSVNSQENSQTALFCWWCLEK